MKKMNKMNKMVAIIIATVMIFMTVGTANAAAAECMIGDAAYAYTDTNGNVVSGIYTDNGMQEEEVILPGNKENHNGGRPTDPWATEPTEPETTEPTTVPVTEPTEPETTEPTTVPVTEPTEPETEPTTVPVTEPTEPETEPTTVPVTEPTTVPVTEPTEPETEPTVPVTEPTEPTTMLDPEYTEPSVPVETEPVEPDVPVVPVGPTHEPGVLDGFDPIQTGSAVNNTWIITILVLALMTMLISVKNNAKVVGESSPAFKHGEYGKPSLFARAKKRFTPYKGKHYRE